MKIKLRLDQMEEVEGLYTQYPYAYHHVDLSRTQIPWHWHEALEFNYILEGTMKVFTAGQSYTFRKGEGFFINSNVLTSMEDVSGCVIDSHLFHPVFLSGHFQSIFETKYLLPVIQNKQADLIPFRGESPAGRQLLQKLRQLAPLQQQENTEFQTRNLVSEIWLLLMEELPLRQPAPPACALRNRERVQTMLAFIHEHFAEKLTLEEIAASASVSPRECLRCFKDAIHQSPIEYLLAYRITAAKKLLDTSDCSITEAALRTGFNSAAYFSQQFKAHTGKTPLSYRKEQNSISKNP